MSGDLIGQTLGQFRILDEIGRGGMGVVYRATDEKLRRTVALKVLAPGFASDPARCERFLREARAAAGINHANIATVYDVGATDGRIYIAMELAPGQSLHALLDQGALPVDDALKVARGIARGLAKAHERGLVHRDLKPDNVMVAEDFDVKILDFGLAKDVGLVDATSGAHADTQAQVTADGQVLGTPAYMSPEQAAGKPVDARSDVFAFGVVLYEMLTGAQPFTGTTTMEVLIAIARDAPPRASVQNPAVGPQLQAVIDRCLEKSADARYRNARELLVALEPFREPGATSRPSIEPPESIVAGVTPQRQPGARPPAWKPALALAAAGLVALVGWRVVTGHDGGAAPASSDTARSDAAPVGVAMTAHPPPKTSVPEAGLEFARALQDMHDGSVALGLQELSHAVVLDPGLAAAHVRLALYRHDNAEGTRSYTAARQLRAQLDERDQMFLRAAESLYTQSDLGAGECVPRLKEIAARFPGDAETYFYLAEHQMIDGQLGAALESIERQLALDPACAAALFQLADAKSRQGDAPGALDAARRCMALSPSAASCIRVQALVHKAQGDCTALLADAREEVAIEPQGNAARGQLSEALAATGAAPEALGEALKQYVATEEPEARPGIEARKRFAASVLDGDFVAAGQALDDVAKAQATTPTPGEPETPVADWLELLRETGDTKRAGALAKDFLARLPSYNRASSRDDVLPAIEAAVVAGDMTRAEATALVRKVLQEETATVGDPKSPEAQRAWRYAYAHDAMTTDDDAALRDLMAAYGKAVPAVDLAMRLTEPPGQAPWWRGFGKALVVTGDVDEGLPLLETAGRACDVLARPLDFVRGVYWLGFAREKKGDGAGACEAYQRVLGTWGHAKPRSTTADRARARMKRIGCGG